MTLIFSGKMRVIVLSKIHSRNDEIKTSLSYPEILSQNFQ